MSKYLCTECKAGLKQDFWNPAFLVIMLLSVKQSLKLSFWKFSWIKILLITYSSARTTVLNQESRSEWLILFYSNLSVAFSDWSLLVKDHLAPSPHVTVSLFLNAVYLEKLCPRKMLH